MVRAFFIELYRNLKKNLVSSSIIFFNLIVGYIAFIALFLIVNGEFNYDIHNKNYDRIYSVQVKRTDTHPIDYAVRVPSLIRYEVFNDMPEVETCLMMREIPCNFFTMKDGSQIRQTNGYFSENTIFDIFTIDIVQGNPQNALTRPNTIAISESFASRIFPDGNAVGSHIVIDKKMSTEVTLVYKDFPGRANVRPDYMISFATYESLNPNFRSWGGWDFNFYVMLKQDANANAINNKIENSIKERIHEEVVPFLHHISLHHISPNNQKDIIFAMYLLGIAAFLILILSYVNFTNLTLANATIRAKEIGIKKVSGCSKMILAIQFISESLIITYISMIVGLLITTLLLPYLNYFLPTSSLVSMDYSLWKNPTLLFIVFGSGTAIGILAGCYPAFVMSSYKSVNILKGKLFSNGEKKISLKKILLVAQFTISIFMLLAGINMTRRVDFMTNSDLGFENKNIVFSENQLSETTDFESIRQQLKQNPDIIDVCYSKTIPFYNNSGGRFSWEGNPDDKKIDCRANFVTYGFLNTFNIPVIEGRDFSTEYPSDNTSCIINETALKAMNMDEPIGKKIDWYGKNFTIIGVVKDFHPYTIHNPIAPYILFLRENDKANDKALLTIRYVPGKEKEIKQNVTLRLSEMFPDEPFVLNSFSIVFDTDMAMFFYRTIKKAFIYFSIISIIMSALGLFAIMSFSVKRRLKEIGVRKVLGSTGSQIFFTLSNGIFLLLGISAVLALPLTLLLIKAINGAMVVPLEISDVLICIGLVAAIVLLTIAYHIHHAVNSNPVESLKYE